MSLPLTAHNRGSLGLIMRLTAANFLVCLAFPWWLASDFQSRSEIDLPSCLTCRSGVLVEEDTRCTQQRLTSRSRSTCLPTFKISSGKNTPVWPSSTAHGGWCHATHYHLSDPPRTTSTFESSPPLTGFVSWTAVWSVFLGSTLSSTTTSKHARRRPITNTKHDAAPEAARERRWQQEHETEEGGRLE